MIGRVFTARRRRLFVERSRILPASWKLRTLVITAPSIFEARKEAERRRRWANEWIDVRVTDRATAEWLRGHQSERAPGGVGML